MGPRAGLDGRKISSAPGFDPGPPFFVKRTDFFNLLEPEFFF